MTLLCILHCALQFKLSLLVEFKDGAILIPRLSSHAVYSVVEFVQIQDTVDEDVELPIDLFVGPNDRLHLAAMHFQKIYSEGNLLITLRIAFRANRQIALLVAPKPQPFEDGIICDERFRIGKVVLKNVASIAGLSFLIVPVLAINQSHLAGLPSKMFVAAGIGDDLKLPRNESDSNHHQHEYQQRQANNEARVELPLELVLIRIDVTVNEASQQAERATEHNSV